MKNENKIKHLEMVENVIDRMASCSFKLKEWSLVIISLAVTIISSYSDKVWLLLLLVPIVCFWFLDAKYLQQERTFRELYDIVRIKNDNEIDFDMNPKQVKISATNKKICFFNSLISWSVLPFYFFISGGIIILYFVLK